MLVTFVLGVALLVAPTGAGRSSAGSLPGLTWSALSPPASPPGLIGAVAAYDSTNSTIVVFGGQLADGQLSSQTWVWDGSTWSLAAPFGASPAPRQRASMAFDTALDPPQLILFGGRGNDGALLDDTWTWNGSSWNQVPTTTAPGGREGAAMTADAAGRLVLFGGYGRIAAPVQGPPTTTTTLPPTTTTTAPSTTTTTTPSSTTTTTIPPSTTTTPTTVPASTTTSSVPSTSTTLPSPSTTAAPAVTSPGQPTPSTTPTVPSSPAGRSGPADLTATAVTPQVLDDTWVLGADGAGNWTQVATSVHPPPTTAASMATGPAGQTMLFGGSASQPGVDQAASTNRQTWLYRGGSWSHVQMAAAPAGRQDASMAYDADLGMTVLVGGLGAAGPLGDTWLWNGATWQAAAPVLAPTARSGAATAYDAASRHLVEFGGTDGAGAALSSTEVLGAHAPIVVPTSGSTTTTTSVAVASGRPSTTTTVGGFSAFGSTSAPPSTQPIASTVPGTSTAKPVHRGDVVTLTGSGFLPHAEITITFHSVATTVSLAEANSAGWFSQSVVVPSQAAVGHHHFEATGLGPDGIIDRITPVRVVAFLPVRHTSTETELILVAVALAIPLLSWAAIDIVGRRRVTLRR